MGDRHMAWFCLVAAGSHRVLTRHTMAGGSDWSPFLRGVQSIKDQTTKKMQMFDTFLTTDSRIHVRIR